MAKEEKGVQAVANAAAEAPGANDGASVGVTSAPMAPDRVRLELPKGVTEVSVAGQRFQAVDGIVEVPLGLAGAVHAHLAGLKQNARSQAERADLAAAAGAKAELRAALEILARALEKADLL
jgi:hypothetical protein